MRSTALCNGYLETDQDLTDEQVEQLRVAWQALCSDPVLLDGPTADAWREWAQVDCSVLNPTWTC